ncbi:GNAT family N-acetyltransferase (plasmid) [Burkholderia aenigmatica]|uniref:GNAT family N-acetyltransferase n=1 Tax=Burkholderia aenigmatica TaxID=2015348 RepID=UPI003B42A8B5
MTTIRDLFSISTVPVEMVYQTRALLLLDGNESAAQFSGDRHAVAFHVAVFQADAIVAVASVCPEKRIQDGTEGDWRLRGLAVSPELQGLGFGRTLVRLCGVHACGNGGSTLWCTARESAKSFYDSLSFTQVGQAFSIPGRNDTRFYAMTFDLGR